MGRPKTKHEREDLQRHILDRLVLRPSLKAAAREAGINPSTIFVWIRESMADPSVTLEWLGQRQPFFELVNAARKLSIVALEHSARDLGINGHTQKLWNAGREVWVHDPHLEALALDPEMWQVVYGDRPITDTFARDEAGNLIQAETTSPPNAQLLAKLLSSLVPGFQEKSEVNVSVNGHVWLEGQTDATKALPAPAPDFAQTFGLSARPDEAKQRPNNVLAIPRPCVDSAEFDSKFRRKLLREVVLFRDSDNKLLPPLVDDLIVAGSVQHRAFQDAHIEVKAVRAETLLDEGFENNFLRELAPGYHRKLKTPSPEERVVVAQQAAAKVAEKLRPVEKPGKASARADSENLGYGHPAPGGRTVRL